MKTRTQIYCAIGDGFIHADGFKKSISQPEFGNYLSLVKTAGFILSVIEEYEL